MIKITNTEFFGLEGALRGMRNPLNSWKYADSYDCFCFENPDCSCYDSETDSCKCGCFAIGDNDMTLAKKLIKAGSDHRKFMRMIHVQTDVLAPLYWWKEYDTYKVGTVANSCSTMHKIHSKEFTLDDFSHEHLISLGHLTGLSEKCLQNTIEVMNGYRQMFIETKDKKYWWQIIQLLPSSYNQLRTIDLNYEVLLNIYHARKNHKLDEWHTFCEWIEKLPYMKDFLGLEEK